MLHTKLIQIIPIKDSDKICCIGNVTGTSKSGKECNFYASTIIPKTGLHANINDDVRFIKNGDYDAYVVTE